MCSTHRKCINYLIIYYSIILLALVTLSNTLQRRFSRTFLEDSRVHKYANNFSAKTLGKPHSYVVAERAEDEISETDTVIHNP